MVQTQFTPRCISGTVVIHSTAVALHKLNSMECLSQQN